MSGFEETLTREQIERIAQEVSRLLLESAQGVGELPKATSLDNLYSLPTIERTGTDERVVEAPISLLRVGIRMGNTAVEWRLGDNGDWLELIPLARITGANGRKPELRKGKNGIEWRYEGEEDSAWETLIGVDELKLRFDDLTPEQRDGLRLRFEHLTPDDKAELMAPATEAAKRAITAAEIAERINEAVSGAEIERQSRETARQSNERARSTAEAERSKAEAARLMAEEARSKAETDRSTAEVGRNDSENLRVGEESKRKEAEASRVAAETARDEAERKRETDTAAAIQAAGKATDEADKAAKRANTAAEAAEGVLSGVRPDWNAPEGSPNYIANKPSIPEPADVNKEYVDGKVGALESKVANLKNYDDTAIREELGRKVDSVEGKGLSSNDFTTEEKNKLAGLDNYDDTGLREAIASKVNSVPGKGLSTNDYDDAAKQRLAELNESVEHMSIQLGSKVDKVIDKDLSTNDYTNEEKKKVAESLRLSVYADVESLSKLPSSPYNLRFVYKSKTAQAINFADTASVPEMQEFYLSILNSSGSTFNQPIPNGTGWQTEVASISLPNGKRTGISIKKEHGVMVVRC